MRGLILLHRYVGIAIGWLLVLWCLSGVVMMYVGYPEVSTAERTRVLPELDLSRCCRGDETFGGITVTAAHVEMLGAGPVLRVTDDFGREWAVDLAEGRFVDRLGRAETDAAAAALASAVPGADPRYRGLIGRDQWTVTAQFDAHRPLHAYTLGDEAGTVWYLSSTTGELVQSTTRRERFWNWLGAVPHWLYPTVLRQNGPLWINTVIAASVVGLFLTVLGLYIGVNRLRRRRSGRWSPYRGIALWHHLLGLAFGVLTLTWLGSGLLSVNPWGLLESAGAGAERASLRGGALDLDDVERWAQGLKSAAIAPGTVRLELTPFAGDRQVVAYGSDGSATRLDPATLEPSPLPRSELEMAAARLAGETPIASGTLLREGDAFYFEHHVERPFPVYRVSLADDERTRYYLDATTGRLLLKVDAERRLYRWLFEGLHRLDFTDGLRERPAWDLLMLVLLAGVTGVCATGTWMGIRFLLR